MGEASISKQIQSTNKSQKMLFEISSLVFIANVLCVAVHGQSFRSQVECLDGRASKLTPNTMVAKQCPGGSNAACSISRLGIRIFGVSMQMDVAMCTTKSACSRCMTNKNKLGLQSVGDISILSCQMQCCNTYLCNDPVKAFGNSLVSKIPLKPKTTTTRKPNTATTRRPKTITTHRPTSVVTKARTTRQTMRPNTPTTWWTTKLMTKTYTAAPTVSGKLMCYDQSWKQGVPRHSIKLKQCKYVTDVCMITRMLLKDKSGKSMLVNFGQCVMGKLCGQISCGQLADGVSIDQTITKCDMDCCNSNFCNQETLFPDIAIPTMPPTTTMAPVVGTKICYLGTWTTTTMEKRSETICADVNDVCTVTRVELEQAGTKMVSYTAQCTPQSLCQMDTCKGIRESMKNLGIKSCSTFCCSEDKCNDPAKVFAEIEKACRFFRTSHDSCCEKVAYYSQTAGCCSGRVYVKKSIGCCKGKRYQLATKYCNNEGELKMKGRR